LNTSVEGNSGRESALVRDLAAIEDTLRNKDYNDAEIRLREMLKDYPREPRIFFALGQTASLAAMDATDEQVQAERLNRALGHYRLAVAASSPETDKAIMSRAHESMGRINAFLENTAEAVKQFDEAIKLGDVRGGAYKEALEGKKKLSQP
jgi:tetratricopeptide (TPR) repeat protein